MKTYTLLVCKKRQEEKLEFCLLPNSKLWKEDHKRLSTLCKKFSLLETLTPDDERELKWVLDSLQTDKSLRSPENLSNPNWGLYWVVLPIYETITTVYELRFP